MVISQYAKLGPLGIWRAFPLARGVGVAWLLFMTINTSHFAKELSRNFVYLVIVSDAQIESKRNVEYIKTNGGNATGSSIANEKRRPLIILPLWLS